MVKSDKWVAKSRPSISIVYRTLLYPVTWVTVRWLGRRPNRRPSTAICLTRVIFISYKFVHFCFFCIRRFRDRRNRNIVSETNKLTLRPNKSQVVRLFTTTASRTIIGHSNTTGNKQSSTMSAVSIHTIRHFYTIGWSH